MLMLFTAGGLSIASMATVYESWRRQKSLVLYIGLTIWVLSAIAWSYAAGWEFGVLYALCLPGLIVWPFIGKNQSTLPVPKNVPQPKSLNFSPQSSMQNLGHAFVVLILLLVTSVVLALALCTLLPFDTAGKLASSVVLLPILWGLAAYHYLATIKKVRAVITYIFVAVISTAILFAVPI